jgi:hypothetical protein
MKLNVSDEKSLQELIKHVTNGLNVFVLIYMNGCGPCNATKPEWAKIDNKWPNTVISQIDKDVINNKTNKDTFHLKDILGFPTIRHYDSKGKRGEFKGNRDKKSFEEWIEKSLASSNKGNTPKIKTDDEKNADARQHANSQLHKKNRIKGGRSRRFKRSRSYRTRRFRLRSRSRSRI